MPCAKPAPRGWSIASMLGRSNPTISSGTRPSGRRRAGPVATLVALMLLAAPLGACSSLDVFGWFGDKNELGPDEPAEKLYNEGLYLLNEKREYGDASKKFEEVDRQHPYSEWARKALLMDAYAYYLAGNYDSAIGAAKRY